ncbi:MAG: hypothetical protein M4579_007733, partial [Chaenotheca gracillima]
MTKAASQVHFANPNILIFFSGQNYDVDISEGVQGFASAEPGFNFSISSLPYVHKFVWENHQYDYSNANSSDCSAYTAYLDGTQGNVTVPGASMANLAPMVMTEWGHDETDASKAYLSSYHQ